MYPTPCSAPYVDSARSCRRPIGMGRQRSLFLCVATDRSTARSQRRADTRPPPTQTGLCLCVMADRLYSLWCLCAVYGHVGVDGRKGAPRHATSVASLVSSMRVSLPRSVFVASMPPPSVCPLLLLTPPPPLFRMFCRWWFLRRTAQLGDHCFRVSHPSPRLVCVEPLCIDVPCRVSLMSCRCRCRRRRCRRCCRRRVRCCRWWRPRYTVFSVSLRVAVALLPPSAGAVRERCVLLFGQIACVYCNAPC
jgi:hypothetical protein